MLLTTPGNCPDSVAVSVWGLRGPAGQSEPTARVTEAPLRARGGCSHGWAPEASVHSLLSDGHRSVWAKAGCTLGQGLITWRTRENHTPTPRPEGQGPVPR